MHVGHGVALWIPTALPSRRNALVIDAITSVCIASTFSRFGPGGPGVGGSDWSGVGGEEALELCRKCGGLLSGSRIPDGDGSCPAVPFRLRFASPVEVLTSSFFFIHFSLSGDGTFVVI